MKTILSSAAMILALSGTAFAEGDVAKGEKDFKKCKACHAIIDADGEALFKGGKTGPNLHGILGRTAGTVEGFKYGDSIIAAGEAGLVWTEELLMEYIKDPKAFLKEQTGDDKAKSKMTFKWGKPEDLVAFLATFSPEMPAEGEAAEGEAAEGEAAEGEAAEGDSATTN
ncbi:cytochrome C [Aliiroseovarius sp. S1339]|uniref:c-type cytochrome n=1 Tax=Aliiroseovarius sp. S1339 TaxID=2936990 RepID=UPI0020C08ECF|nr:cytochrome C [Aliiroseovarius sp. S1339]MCK8465280.1 cytochrome C [Aliiroseovarius sp. S1339]